MLVNIFISETALTVAMPYSTVVYVYSSDCSGNIGGIAYVGVWSASADM